MLLRGRGIVERLGSDLDAAGKERKDVPDVDTEDVHEQTRVPHDRPFRQILPLRW